MIKKLLISFGIIFSLLAPSVYANAQSSRVGVVNIDRLMSESNMAKASQTKLEQEFSARQKALETQAAKLQTMLDAYQKDLPTMSQATRESREKTIRTEDEAFARTNSEFQRDLNNRRAQEVQALLNKANEAVRQVAASDKYDIILTEAVYAKPELDVTDKVLRILNSGK